MSKDEINDLALGWFEKGVNKIVALRGDVREKNKQYVPHPNGYQNAADMCLGLKKLANFEIAVGGYPEIHPDSKNKQDDTDHLKRKVDAGADKIITQYFFDKDVFLRYRDSVVAAGINIPIIPGIMPISNFKKVKNFSAMCGASIPDWIASEFSGLDDTPEVQQLVGASLASDLVKKLKKEEVNEFHFYTLNKYELTFAVCSRLLSLQNNLNQNNQTKGEARA
jgi:methylenetetrahydrofolate reductase (NADPH)